MPRGQQTKGACVFCGRELTRSGMAKHLKACPGRREAIQAADARAEGAPERLYRLQVHPEWGSVFWLQLEAKGSARLEDLDHYLRWIWLECCGHMSQFSFGGWRGEEISMRRRIEHVLRPGDELTHIYDFGTESVTLVRVMDIREGQPLSTHPIFPMARNHMPEHACAECGEPAQWACQQCLYEGSGEGTFCGKHAEEHLHDEYGEPFPLVNSPRLGLCGYTGPAHPPY